MEYSPDRGKDRLTMQISTVVAADGPSTDLCHAKLNYISCHAMYFEAEIALEPGTLINIQFNKPPLKGASTFYNARVHWCMRLSSEKSISNYGMGVKYFTKYP